MNVSELVRRLNTTREELLTRLPELGFQVGKKAIKVNDHLVDNIVRAWNDDKKKRMAEEEGKRREFLQEEVLRIESQRQASETTTQPEKTIFLPGKIAIKELAKRLQYPVNDLLAELMKNGIMSAMNEEIDYDTAAIIASDLGFTTEKKEEDTDHQQKDLALLDSALGKSDPKDLTKRPPVVVVMGHVDHGKTKLLDAIRKTHIAEGEAGGITQAIGAYQVEHKGQPITFIDTPGHEAFTAMRSRGARVADIAVLVVAADDGVKPQTKEALRIIKQAGIPFVVAINKIDKDEADIERVKKELSELQLVPEDWGGNTICVPLSAKQEKGIYELLEMLVLVADMHKDSIVSQPTGPALGTIIDSRIDRGEGPLATVLVQLGSLHPSDLIMVGGIPGKVKAMKDFKNRAIVEALPSTPVQVLGLKQAPAVGDILQVVTDKKVFKKKLKEKKHVGTSSLSSHIVQDAGRQYKKLLPVILKADTLGSLEAILESLKKIQHAEIAVDVVSKGLGNVNDHDITEASESGALLLGFNVHILPGAEGTQMRLGAQVFTYKVIYDLLDKVKESLSKLLSPEILKVVIGRAKILALFRSTPSFKIVGARVVEGEVVNRARVELFRDEQKIDEGTIDQLQSEKKNVGSVANGQECGMKLECRTEVKEGDTLEVYKEEEKQRFLK